MAQLSPQELNRLARLGAQARLEELRQEEANIRAAFPDLFGAAGGGRRRGRGRGSKRAAAPAEAATARRATRRRKSNMSPAARKAVSERMRKYWAERRKAKGAEKK